MPLRLVPSRQFSKTLATKLRPVWLGRGIRSLGRGISRIPIGPVIVAVETAGNVGSSVPVVQGISSAVVTLLQRAQGVGRNREECKALATLAESVASAVVDATGDVRELEELDEKTLLSLAELEWRMEQIVKTMTRLERKPVWRRFWHKDKHDAALIEHKESLKHALRIFQVSSFSPTSRGEGMVTELVKTINNSVDRFIEKEDWYFPFPVKLNDTLLGGQYWTSPRIDAMVMNTCTLRHKAVHEKSIVAIPATFYHEGSTSACAGSSATDPKGTTELMKTIKNSDDPLHLIDLGKLLYPEKRNRSPERGH
ncbi:hypothetical protein VTO73DRAFT_5962 [Trametes versicolor]